MLLDCCGFLDDTGGQVFPLVQVARHVLESPLVHLGLLRLELRDSILEVRAQAVRLVMSTRALL